MKHTKVSNTQLVEIPKITDPRGNLAVIENAVLPFKMKRVYYLYDVPSDSVRGGHAHKELQQFLIAISGSFDVVLEDGESVKTITLNKSNKGLLLVPGIWRELNNFSSGAVCLVIASETYLESDYIRDKETFIKYKNQSV